MKTYNVTITGRTALLMHCDNIAWADEMSRWKDDPANKKTSKAGDDRSPAHRWIGCLYHDDKLVSIPSDNLMRCLMEGGAMVPVPGGRGNKTFKSQTQSGCVVGEPFWPLMIEGKTIPIQPILALVKEQDFAAHQTAVAKMGFDLLLKRAKIQNSKHVRVRPRFSSWSASGTLNVWDDQLTGSVLNQIWTYAGQYKGLGDWRPGGKTPGSFGMFAVEIDEK